MAIRTGRWVRWRFDAPNELDHKDGTTPKRVEPVDTNVPGALELNDIQNFSKEEFSKMSNPVSNFFHFILHVKTKVSDLFVHLFGAQTASEIANAAIHALEQTKLGAAALEYVTEFAKSDYAALASDVKRLQVFSKLQAFAEANGFGGLPDSVLNWLIETAVLYVKNQFAAASAHDPANPPASLPPTPAA